MSDQTPVEARLSAAELEVVNASRSPAIEQASDEQLKILAQRLRRARDRAKDIAARQKREMRGKAQPKGTKRTRDNTGTLAKAQVLGEAIERVEEELSRREKLATTTTTQADLSRHAKSSLARTVVTARSSLSVRWLKSSLSLNKKRPPPPRETAVRS